MAGLLEIGLSNAAMAGVLAVLAAVLCRLYRRPAFAHGLWLVVLLKLVTPPLVPVPLPWFDAPETAEPSAADPVAVFLPAEDGRTHSVNPVDAPLPEQAEAPVLPSQPSIAGAAGGGGIFPVSWWTSILLLWLAGSLCAVICIVRSVSRFQGLLRYARPADPGLQDLVRELAGKLKLTRLPQVWLVPGIVSPMLWAVGGRPRLLLPAQLLERLDRDQLRTIVLHELAHWRRRDHWVRLVELVVLCLYWWNPVVWWVRAELREAEEQCCDAWVIATLEGADRTYAMALLQTVAFLSSARLPLPVSASGIGRVTHLRRRLTMIMNGQKRRSLTWAGCAGLLGFGMLFLPLLPVRAQQAETKKDRPAAVEVQVEGLQLFIGDDGPADKEAVELLKKALKILVEKKGAGKQPEGKASRVGNSEETRKARAEVDALARQVAEKRRELEATETRLRAAQARLANLQGPTTIQVPQLRWIIRDGKKGDGKAKVIMLIQKDGKPFSGTIQLGGLKLQKNQADPLQMRLERLLREVEELRQQIRQRDTKAKGKN
jgi:beta-lactamase regulating signal transducer with metallopeptidase domain